MSGKRYDAATKTLLGIRPHDWLRFLGLPTDVSVEILDTDLSSVSAAADGLLKVGEESPFGLHIEFESRHGGKQLPTRLLSYNIWAAGQTGLVILSIAFLLTPEADSPAITSLLEQRLPDSTLIHAFYYKVVRVWQVAPEQFLSAGLGLVPLAPLGNVAVGELPEVVRKMEEQLDTAIDSHIITDAEAADLWTATYFLMGSRYTKEQINQLLKGVRRMKDSVTYQAVLDEGREEGRQQGREEGRVATVRRNILVIGNKRFGKPTEATLRILDQINSGDYLESLVDRLIEVETWDELLRST